MPTYATEGELVAYAEGTGYELRIPQDAPGRNRLLEQAERDVDQVALGAGFRDETTGLMWTPAQLAGDLTAAQRGALSRAVCAQALYRVEMGPEHFVQAQRESVSGRSFSAKGKLPIVGPQAYRELTFSDVLQLSTSQRNRQRYGDIEPDERDGSWHEV